MLTPQERERLVEIERELAKDATLARMLASGRPTPAGWARAVVILGYLIGALLLGVGAIVGQVAPAFLGMLTVAATSCGHLAIAR